MRILTIGLIVSFCFLSCTNSNTSKPIAFGDSVSIRETVKLVQSIYDQKTMADRGWPSPVKGFPNYHFEKPMLINGEIAGYMVRDYEGDSLTNFEDYIFSKGKLVSYQYLYIDSGYLKVNVRYWFKNRHLIDSSIKGIASIPVEEVLNKADKHYFIASNKTDSLNKRNEEFKRTLSRWRDSINKLQD